MRNWSLPSGKQLQFQKISSPHLEPGNPSFPALEGSFYHIIPLLGPSHPQAPHSPSSTSSIFKHFLSWSWQPYLLHTEVPTGLYLPSVLSFPSQPPDSLCLGKLCPSCVVPDTGPGPLPCRVSSKTWRRHLTFPCITLPKLFPPSPTQATSIYSSLYLSHSLLSHSPTIPLFVSHFQL